MTVNVWESYMRTAVEETNEHFLSNNKKRPEKNSGSYGICTYDLCDTDA